MYICVCASLSASHFEDNARFQSLHTSRISNVRFFNRIERISLLSTTIALSDAGNFFISFHAIASWILVILDWMVRNLLKDELTSGSSNIDDISL